MKSVFLTILFLFSIQIGLSQENKTKSEQKAILIYGSDTCHYCVDTKKYAEDHQLKFIYFDIDKDEKALKEMLTKLRQNNISTANLNLPVVDKNGLVFTNEIDFSSFLKKLIE
jgi:glutaredoxin